MRKQIYMVLILISTFSLFSETLFQVITNNEESYIGYIIEDNPGSILILEDELNGEVYAISYKDILLIRTYKKKDDLEQDIVIDPIIIVEPELFFESLESIEPLPKLGFTFEFLKDNIEDLSLINLNRLNLDEEVLKDTPRALKEDIYNQVKKDDTLKYTLLNIIPGLGSLLQGDYYASLYTISSVLTGVLYNAAYNGEGTDFYFIVNLNAALAYVSGFVAPLRYNMEYNNIVKDKLSL